MLSPVSLGSVLSCKMRIFFGIKQYWSLTSGALVYATFVQSLYSFLTIFPWFRIGNRAQATFQQQGARTLPVQRHRGADGNPGLAVEKRCAGAGAQHPGLTVKNGDRKLFGMGYPSRYFNVWSLMWVVHNILSCLDLFGMKPSVFGWW